MLRSRRWIDEQGSASLEFVTVGLLLLLPLIYLVLVVAAVQSRGAGRGGAARHAARLFVQQPDLAQAEAVTARTVRFVLGDYGVDAASSRDSGHLRPDGLPRTRRPGHRPGDGDRAAAARAPGASGRLPLSVDLQAASAQRVSAFGPG